MIIDTSTVVPTAKLKAREALALARAKHSALTEGQRTALDGCVGGALGGLLIALIAG